MKTVVAEPSEIERYDPGILVVTYTRDGSVSGGYVIDEGPGTNKRGKLNIKRADAILRRHGLDRISPWTEKAGLWAADVDDVNEIAKFPAGPNPMFITICDQIPGDCTSDLAVNDTVLTPDGPGTIEALHTLTAEVRLEEERDGAPIRSFYTLDFLHLSEWAGAWK
jgi:hypothetical protein